MDLLARPCVEIIHGVGDNLAAETTPLRAGSVDPFAFESALPDTEVFSRTGRAKIALGHFAVLSLPGGGRTALVTVNPRRGRQTSYGDMRR